MKTIKQTFLLLMIVCLLFVLIACDTASTGSQDLTFTTDDGVVHAATWYPAAISNDGGDGTTAVLLLHMLDSNRTVWAEFAGELNAAGYSALAVDLRGHGDTGGSRDWTLAPNDVHQAWELMVRQPGVDPQKTAIIGASIGANLALIEGANEPRIQSVALLSPSLDYRGVKTEDAIRAFGDRPILIVNSSDDDMQIVLDGFKLGKLTQNENSSVRQLMDSGHGTDMLTNNVELSNQLSEWLDLRIEK